MPAGTACSYQFFVVSLCYHKANSLITLTALAYRGRLHLRQGTQSITLAPNLAMMNEESRKAVLYTKLPVAAWHTWPKFEKMHVLECEGPPYVHSFAQRMGA